MRSEAPTPAFFVPRLDLDSLTVLPVIGALRSQRRGSAEDQRQVPMFESDGNCNPATFAGRRNLHANPGS
jgi:hypothetical protein